MTSPRTTSPPPANTISSSAGQLLYIPFALDAVTDAVGPATAGTIGGVPAAATKITGVGQFTLTQLQQLYATGTPVTVTVNGASVTYAPAGGPQGLPAGDVPIDLYVPQAGAGTRTFWLAQMGITGNLPAWVFDTIQSDGGLTPASFVNQPIQQNDGTAAAVDPNGIEVYSIAQWIGQNRNVDDRLHGAQIEPISGVTPTTGSGAMNVSFPIRREVYSTVAFDRVVNTGDGNFDLNLAGLLVGTSSAVCRNSLVITQFGFAPLTTAPLGHHCGDVDATNLRAFTSNQI